jgi:hypothetical protein
MEFLSNFMIYLKVRFRTLLKILWKEGLVMNIKEIETFSDEALKIIVLEFGNDALEYKTRALEELLERSRWRGTDEAYEANKEWERD